MRRHVVTLAGLSLLLTALALGGPVALAGVNPGYTFTRTPDHGKPGTVIHFEGTGCEYQGKPYQGVWIFLRYDRDGNKPPRAAQKYDIANDGSFSGDVTVPKDAPAGHYVLTAQCYASDMAFAVGDLDFTVDGSPPSPKPTRTASPTPQPTLRPTPSRTPTPRPSATRTLSPSPTASRTSSRALASPSPLLASPSPTAIASARLGDSHNGPPPALLAAAAVLIAANGLGLRAAGRRSRR